MLTVHPPRPHTPTPLYAIARTWRAKILKLYYGGWTWSSRGTVSKAPVPPGEILVPPTNGRCTKALQRDYNRRPDTLHGGYARLSPLLPPSTNDLSLYSPELRVTPWETDNQDEEGTTSHRESLSGRLVCTPLSPLLYIPSHLVDPVYHNPPGTVPALAHVLRPKNVAQTSGPSVSAGAVGLYQCISPP